MFGKSPIKIRSQTVLGYKLKVNGPHISVKVIINCKVKVILNMCLT